MRIPRDDWRVASRSTDPAQAYKAESLLAVRRGTHGSRLPVRGPRGPRSRSLLQPARSQERPMSPKDLRSVCGDRSIHTYHYVTGLDHGDGRGGRALHDIKDGAL